LHPRHLHSFPTRRSSDLSRLLRAAEEAKKRLSFEPYTRLAEEHLAVRDGVSLHLDLEVSREEYERLIRHLVESTLDSVHRALARSEERRVGKEWGCRGRP